MQRLTGIGASPGVVAGRAVVLIQREQVLRYRVPAARVEKEIGAPHAEPRPDRGSSSPKSAAASIDGTAPSSRRSSTRSC